MPHVGDSIDAPPNIFTLFPWSWRTSRWTSTEFHHRKFHGIPPSGWCLPKGGELCPPGEVQPGLERQLHPPDFPHAAADFTGAPAGVGGPRAAAGERVPEVAVAGVHGEDPVGTHAWHRWGLGGICWRIDLNFAKELFYFAELECQCAAIFIQNIQGSKALNQMNSQNDIRLVVNRYLSSRKWELHFGLWTLFADFAVLFPF